MPCSGEIFSLKRPNVVPCSVFVTKKRKNRSILHDDILLTKECDRKVPSTSAGPHLPCPSLWSLFLTSSMPCHIPPAETLFSPSLLPPGHHSVLSAYSPSDTSEDQALLLAQLLTSSKRCLWILYTITFLLSPCGEVGIREWVLIPDPWVHPRLRMLLLVSSGCLFRVCGMYQVPPCGHTEKGFSSSKPPPLPYIAFSCPLPFQSEMSC